MANATVADDMRAMFGPVKRWKDGEIYFAENDLFKMAYAVTADRAKIGTIGAVRGIFVEWISEEHGKLLDVKCQRQS